MDTLRFASSQLSSSLHIWVFASQGAGRAEPYPTFYSLKGQLGVRMRTTGETRLSARYVRRWSMYMQAILRT